MKHSGTGPQEPGVYIAIEGATGVGKTTLATKIIWTEFGQGDANR